MKTGILLVVDGWKPRYSAYSGLEKSLGGFGTPLSILARRFASIPGIDEIALSAPEEPEGRSLAVEAAALKVPASLFDFSKIRAKPWSASQERWRITTDFGLDELAGLPVAEAATRFRWDRIVLVPLTHLLVDRRGIIESLALHAREGFDVTFAEDRLVGAGWMILESPVILGLQSSHPDIMQTRGGFIWAVREPLYPFKIGEYHAPRNRPRLPADMRITSQRARHTLETSGGADFASSKFDYLSWVNDSGWEERYLEYGPLTAVIEPSSECHGACLHCPQPKLNRPRASMSLATFERITNFLAPVDGLNVTFSGMGEPLCNSNFGKMVKLTDNKHIILYTSLAIEQPQDFSWNSFDLVRISVDAASEEKFKEVRPGCSWERIFNFLQYAYSCKSRCPDDFPEIGVSFLKHRENESEVNLFLRYWKQVCKPVFQSHFFVWPLDAAPQRVQWYQIIGAAEYLGAVEYAGTARYTPLNRRPCLHALSSIQFLQDGNIARCPYDIEGSYGWGKLPPAGDVLEFWNSDPLKAFRHEHLNLAFAENSPCRTCNDWYHRE